MGLNISKELDTIHLQKVYGEDANIISLIFDAFVTDSYVRWQDLRTVLESYDLKESANIVHGLKPSFPMAGMTWLRPKVEELERAIKAEAPAAVLWPLFEAIDQELTRLVPTLKAEAKRLSFL